MSSTLFGALLALSGFVATALILREVRDAAAVRYFYGGFALFWPALAALFLGAVYSSSPAVVLGGFLLGAATALMAPGYRPARLRY